MLMPAVSIIEIASAAPEIDPGVRRCDRTVVCPSAWSASCTTDWHPT